MIGSKKVKSIYACSNCSTQYPAWTGQCTVCQEWNTIEALSSSQSTSSYRSDKQVSKPIAITDIKDSKDYVFETGISEFDRVLGGGITSGSVNLIGGEPGIGKSTLGLQILQQFSLQGKKFCMLQLKNQKSSLCYVQKGWESTLTPY